MSAIFRGVATRGLVTKAVALRSRGDENGLRWELSCRDLRKPEDCYEEYVAVSICAAVSCSPAVAQLVAEPIESNARARAWRCEPNTFFSHRLGTDMPRASLLFDMNKRWLCLTL